MRIHEVSISNFRAHQNTKVPISNFGCLIGENNAGKSSVLHAIHFALKGSLPNRLDDNDYRNPDEPIRIELAIDEISPSDLERIIDPSHRASIANIVVEGTLRLVRSAPREGKAVLQYLSLQPIDARWSLEALSAAMKGKSGPALLEAAVTVLPDLKSVDGPLLTQAKIKDARLELLKGLAEDEYEVRDTPLPTGIEAALRPLFPEVIYIEAVKDAAAETRTSDTATFGKLLRILLDAVADEVTDLASAFEKVQRKLSRVQNPDGTFDDSRLDKVRTIETTIENLVQESFPGVTLKMEVPAPDLKTILNSAELQIDDGHEGPVGRKGDGLKRAVAFAILRAYMAILKDGLSDDADETRKSPAYLLLFEEPELYLHPRAQQQLFEALSVFSRAHQVVVTTHSPSFFSANATSTFVKLYKSSADGHRPHSKALPIDLREQMTLRNAFQIVCHENNEAALFARVVVLVEGDSDTIVFPHLAKTLNPSWDHITQNVSFIQTGGKSNIERYREFFSLFDIPVHAIADLDAIDDGFDKLTQSQKIRKMRGSLMGVVNRKLQKAEMPAESGSKIRAVAKSGTQRDRWEAAKAAYDAWSSSQDQDDFETIQANLESFFYWTHGKARLETLTSDDTEIAASLNEIVMALRSERTHVLRRGDLESYYASPPAKLSVEKVQAAVDFCSSIRTRGDLVAKHGSEGAAVERELREIFESIFA